MKKWLAFLAAVLLVGFVSGCGDDGDNPADTDQTPDPAYVGSAVCIDCHKDLDPDLVEAYLESGHPYKLNKVVDGQQPDYPFTPDFNPPAGFSWEDVTYVIGGYHWKARWLDS